MIEEKEMFSILLPIENITWLYLNIGDTICTDIDFTGYSYNTKAISNSLNLLIDLNFIVKVDGTYYKETKVEKEIFQVELNKLLFLRYRKTICDVIFGKTQYDIERKEIFIMRNSIPLNVTGLFMILNDYEEVHFFDNRVIIGKKVQDLFIKQASTRKVSIEELEKRLIKDRELGEQAEKFAMQYEKIKLHDSGISLEPEQISLIDASAGFDILSFFSNNIENEKYIEVKSCDEKYAFHISENEIKKAKTYGDRYYLYLFNRYEKSIKEIQNPYRFYFEKETDCWIIETDGYKIHKI